MSQFAEIIISPLISAFLADFCAKPLIGDLLELITLRSVNIHLEHSEVALRSLHPHRQSRQQIAVRHLPRDAQAQSAHRVNIEEAFLIDVVIEHINGVLVPHFALFASEN